MSSSALAPLADPAVVDPGPVFVDRLRTHRDAVAPPRLTVVRPTPPARPRPVPVPRPPNQQELRQRLREVLEVLDGRRPVGQLDLLVPESTAHRLLTWARTAPAPRRLRSVHPYRTTPTAIDLCATVDTGRRTRAMAGRLEVQHDRWCFTLLRLL